MLNVESSMLSINSLLYDTTLILSATPNSRYNKYCITVSSGNLTLYVLESDIYVVPISLQ